MSASASVAASAAAAVVAAAEGADNDMFARSEKIRSSYYASGDDVDEKKSGRANRASITEAEIELKELINDHSKGTKDGPGREKMRGRSAASEASTSTSLRPRTPRPSSTTRVPRSGAAKDTSREASVGASAGFAGSAAAPAAAAAGAAGLEVGRDGPLDA